MEKLIMMKDVIERVRKGNHTVDVDHAEIVEGSIYVKNKGGKTVAVLSLDMYKRFQHE